MRAHLHPGFIIPLSPLSWSSGRCGGRPAGWIARSAGDSAGRRHVDDDDDADDADVGVVVVKASGS